MERAAPGYVWTEPIDDDEEVVNEWNYVLSQADERWCEERAASYLCQKNTSPRAGTAEQRFKRHVMNWMGQLVAARCLDIGVLSDPEIRKKGHLEHAIEVRVTDFQKPSLYLNDRDVLGRAYVLVRMTGRIGTCMGWIRFTEEAKRTAEFKLRPGNTGKPQECWIFPVIKLNTMLAMKSRLTQLRTPNGI